MIFQLWDEILKSSQTGKGFFGSQRALLMGIDTFIRRPSNVTKNAPHIRDATDLKRIMVIVVLALFPCTLFGIWNAGKNTYHSIGINHCTFMDAFSEGSLHVIPLILLSYIVGGFCEVIFAQIRNHEIAEGFLVTGLLYPLTCPPTIPWWIFSIGIIFGIIIGKELFGGTGMNIVNPALFSRAFLFFSYPAAMSGDEVWIKKPFYENLKGDLIASSWTTISHEKINYFINHQNIDSLSGQTPLALATNIANTNDTIGNINNNINQIYSKINMFVGNIPGSLGETSTLMCLAGAFVLIITQVGSWRTILGVYSGAALTVLILGILQTSNIVSLIQISYLNHILMGGFSFGAIFMATDPVSGPLYKTSQWIYGGMIGFLCILIRTINPAFPEGMMMAILFMNIFSPLIDHYVSNFKVIVKKEN